MRVCLICVELFAWGKYGGFGRAARMLGRELVKQGIEVFAVVPKRPSQQPEENLDGITVLGFPPFEPWKTLRLYRKCNADIYHSQEASVSSYLAVRAAPGKKHLITFRDHKLFRDWLVELRYPSRNHLRTLLGWIYEGNHLVERAIRRADRLAVCAPHLADRVIQRYRLRQPPLLLPTPLISSGAASCQKQRANRLFPRPLGQAQASRAVPGTCAGIHPGKIYRGRWWSEQAMGCLPA
jgi:glycosyltransferase involved in cell wall biosynthesis